MPNWNEVRLMGNLTRDPELKYTPSGVPVCEIGLAVNKEWFDKQSNSKKSETTFVDVTFWSRTAEVAAEYLKKGKPVFVAGELKQDSWTDKESGQKRTKLKVTGHQMQLLGGRGPEDQRPANDDYGEEPQTQPAKPSINPDRMPPATSDDVPF